MTPVPAGSVDGRRLLDLQQLAAFGTKNDFGLRLLETVLGSGYKPDQGLESLPSILSDLGLNAGTNRQKLAGFRSLLTTNGRGKEAERAGANTHTATAGSAVQPGEDSNQ